MLHDYSGRSIETSRNIILQKAWCDEPRASETKATNNQEKEVDNRKDPWMELIVGDEIFSATNC